MEEILAKEDEHCPLTAIRKLVEPFIEKQMQHKEYDMTACLQNKMCEVSKEMRIFERAAHLLKLEDFVLFKRIGIGEYFRKLTGDLKKEEVLT